ncbi:conserved hypothetical protein [Trichinella spiralis]|uniref:hypothetical protein n=1 Tax=Trichinella spiralis TaxID=6334 RepID=UPI0001EFEFE8|nr:conserved hypothetical protein [Trichinella spiralis]
MAAFALVHLEELLNYYIDDELQTLLCEVDAQITDCPLTVISCGTHDILAQSLLVVNYGRSGRERNTGMKRIKRRWNHQRSFFAIIENTGGASTSDDKDTPSDQKERPYWSRCSSREMEFLQELDGSICAVQLVELLNYYIGEDH